MNQIIGEEVAVAGVYAAATFQPKKFRWRGQTLIIQEVCEVHNFRDGTMRKRRFSVMAKNTLYLLEFNRDTEKWTLEQIWVEG